MSFILLVPATSSAHMLFPNDGVAVDLGMLRPAIANGDVVPSSMNDLRAMTPRIYIKDSSEETVEENYCTGLLIAPKVVLTAAHCVASDPKKLFVKVYFQEKEVGVEKIVTHPEHEPLRYEQINGRMEARGGFNDVALLFLDESLNSITPALLPVPDYRLKDKQKVILAGYGLLGEKPNKDEELYYVKVSVDEIPKGRLRVYGKKTSCSGDSGGPVLKKQDERWMSVGVISLGDCESISTQMRTSAFTEWILDEVATFDSYIRI